MATKRRAPKKRSAAAHALALPLYRQRKVPGKKSRGRARMDEIYARESRCVESENESWMHRPLAPEDEGDT